MEDKKHLTDSQIAQQATLKPISTISEQLNLTKEDLVMYGDYKAKVKMSTVQKIFDEIESGKRKKGKLILVSAITPTPLGEGKTTVSIGLTQGLRKVGKKAVVALREPSLGPCFGVKGGAAGGGHSQVLPMEDINLHFTGDLHAVGAGHNLISAMLDNHVHFGIDPIISIRDIHWKRVMDMNDRSLRSLILSLGKNGITREGGFDITAASEIMAILCLSKNYREMKEKIGRILIGLSLDGKKPVYANTLKAEGAVTALLKDALMPNLVQTIEHGPAFIHGGPFANIAQGANSILATKLSMGLSDYTITEAGFGFDLGGEKFFNIVSRYGEFAPDAVVLVATIRALKHHGGASKEELSTENLERLQTGFCNLKRHIENAKSFGRNPIIAINKFPTDTQKEVDLLKSLCQDLNVRVQVADIWANGGDGGQDLASAVVEAIEQDNVGPINHTYDLSDSVEDKIFKVASKIYGAKDIYYFPKAKKDLALIKENNLSNLPICMAKTQSSLSDNPKLKGAPEGFTLSVREVIVSSGAGFLVPVTGEIMRMPGLPKHPAAMDIDIDPNGMITGLF